MHYKLVYPAVFLERPNRFIARCLLDGQEVRAHVKNTGRCRELLLPGATVYLEKAQNPQRKTAYSLIAVEKGDLLINMDSQAPNALAEEAILSGRWRCRGFTPEPLPCAGRSPTGIPGLTSTWKKGSAGHLWR